MSTNTNRNPHIHTLISSQIDTYLTLYKKEIGIIAVFANRTSALHKKVNNNIRKKTKINRKRKIILVSYT